VAEMNRPLELISWISYDRTYFYDFGLYLSVDVLVGLYIVFRIKFCPRF
jgi:hypothetical protein